MTNIFFFETKMLSIINNVNTSLKMSSEMIIRND